MRNIFSTRTAKGAYISAFAGAMMLVLPQVQNLIDRNIESQKARENAKDILMIVLTLCGGGAITGSATSFLGRLIATEEAGFHADKEPQLLQGSLREVVDSTKTLALAAGLVNKADGSVGLASTLPAAGDDPTDNVQLGKGDVPLRKVGFTTH